MNRTQRLLAAAALAAATPAAAQIPSQGPSPSSPQTTPIPLTQIAPEWPAELRRDSIEGRVVLNVHVGADGRVLETQPLRFGLRHAGSGAAIAPGSPYEATIAATASEAARRWTFTPAMRGGEPVAAWMTLPMHFQMGNGTVDAAKTACAVPADVRPGGPPTNVLLMRWTAAPGAGGQSQPVTAADRPWLECLTGRLREDASSEVVRTYRSWAVAALAQAGGR